MPGISTGTVNIGYVVYMAGSSADGPTCSILPCSITTVAFRIGSPRPGMSRHVLIMNPLPASAGLPSPLERMGKFLVIFVGLLIMICRGLDSSRFRPSQTNVHVLSLLCVMNKLYRSHIRTNETLRKPTIYSKGDTE